MNATTDPVEGEILAITTEQDEQDEQDEPAIRGAEGRALGTLKRLKEEHL